MATPNKAINEVRELIKDEAIKNRFDQVIKYLKKNKVELTILKINLVKAFCEIEFFMFDMATVLREEKKYSSETENMRGSKKLEKNPILPEYRGMIAEYKRYQEILENWIKEASNKAKPISKDEKDEFAILEKRIKEKNV